MQFHQKWNARKTTTKQMLNDFTVKDVSNDADSIVMGDGSAERGNEEWDGDILFGNDNALGNVSITATFRQQRQVKVNKK